MTTATKPRHGTYASSCVVGYLRVSTSEQAASGAGIDAQRAAIEAYAERAGLTIGTWAIDEAVSGSVAPLERPGLGDALAKLAACRGGALIVAKLDRVARKSSDLLALRDLAEAEGWALSAADGSIDTATPHGRAMTTVMSAFSELERDLIRSRTRDALAAKRESGVRLGRKATLDPAVRDRVVRERAAGRTMQAIADGLNADNIPTARGGTVWRSSTVNAVLVSVAHDDYASLRREITG